MKSCPHGFPKPENCYECMEEGNFSPPPPKPKIVSTDKRTEAKYDGHCQNCNLGIHVNQLIVQMTDGTWQHDHHWAPAGSITLVTNDDLLA